MQTESTSKRAPTHITISNESISRFSSDVESLWSNFSSETNEIPSPLEFLREYVALSKPLLIRNAFPKKSLDEIIDDNADDDLQLNVDTTPDGHGDCIRVVNEERMFVMPQVQQMNLLELRDGLRDQQNRNVSQKSHTNSASACTEKDENGLQKLYDGEHSSYVNNTRSTHDENESILYYSRQNDCLRSELPSLANLFPESIQFADEAFNAKPDAVNLWIGNERSISSMHKDHYENIFCVAHGEKIFTLCPPADALFLKETMLPSGTFRKDDTIGWMVDRQCVDKDGEKCDQMVRWMETDVEQLLPPVSDEDRQSYIRKHQLLQYAHPFRIHVKAGDMLYLPSLWYHRVTQTCETVAVNYWYDMRFDSPSWCHFNFLQHIQCNDEN